MARISQRLVIQTSATTRNLLSLSLALCSILPLAAQSTYLGFDRNDYPGDANLKNLRQTFTFTGYWLNHPPGEKTNTWLGKRKVVESAGFGFLVLFNGRLYAELKSVPRAKGSSRKLSFFLTRSKADACCPSRKPISTHGQTR